MVGRWGGRESPHVVSKDGGPGSGPHKGGGSSDPWKDAEYLKERIKEAKTKKQHGKLSELESELAQTESRKKSGY